MGHIIAQLSPFCIRATVLLKPAAKDYCSANLSILLSLVCAFQIHYTPVRHQREALHAALQGFIRWQNNVVCH